MKITRDSILLDIGIIAGLSAALASHWDVFPWVSPTAQHGVELVGFIAGTVSGLLRSSPLAVSPEGHREEVVAYKQAVADQAVALVNARALPPVPPPPTPPTT